MTEPLDLDALTADAGNVKFCPHMDWHTNRCTNCRAYRTAKAVEGLIAELRATRGERDDWRRVAAEQTRLERDRAERAEAAIARVRGWIEENGRWDDDTLDGLIAALDGTDV